ncbi:hypothetical protein AAG570_005288 [Ranatra chinensis]|uniref:Uncharacterized protein n=1 Tax=Ranatra chinensis TaxID=642074 RepID=A0ABD0YEU4_9HEMI
MYLEYGGEDLRHWGVFANLENGILETVELFQVFGELNECGLFVTSDDEVYVVGDNCDGQLGLDASFKKATSPVRVDGLCYKNVIELCCGWWHVIALCSDGSVYSMGDNTWGQLGRDTNPTETVGKVNIKEPVLEVACGIRHTLLLTDSLKVYNFGDCSGKQCYAQESILRGLKEPLMVPLDGFEGIPTAIACGARSSLVFSDRKEVCFWGTTVSLSSVMEYYPQTGKQEAVIPVGDSMLTFKANTTGIEADQFFKFPNVLNDIISGTSPVSVIEINDYNEDVYFAFLRYLYTGELTDCNLDQIVVSYYHDNGLGFDSLGGQSWLKARLASGPMGVMAGEEKTTIEKDLDSRFPKELYQLAEIADVPMNRSTLTAVMELLQLGYRPHAVVSLLKEIIANKKERKITVKI